MRQLIQSKVIQRRPMTSEITLIRVSPDGEHFLKEAVHTPGLIYNEYVEVWRKLSDDPKWELHPDVPKERLSQVATGRRFLYVDRISGELYDDNAKIKEKTDAMFVIVSPSDWTIHRFDECTP